MAAAAHCAVVPVDMGIAGTPVAGVINCRVALGTADFTRKRPGHVPRSGCAVHRLRYRAGTGAKRQGVQMLATGEMGIGNTTTSSAVASVLLGRPVQEMTGRGAGLSDEGLRRKIDAIRRGIVVNRPMRPTRWACWRPWAALTSPDCAVYFLGGALENVPILMDGFISGVAALCAVRLCPAAAKAAFASHVSSEPAARLVLEELDKNRLSPPICT